MDHSVLNNSRRESCSILPVIITRKSAILETTTIAQWVGVANAVPFTVHQQLGSTRPHVPLPVFLGNLTFHSESIT